jgi:DNA-binding response OmpR family regulator
MTVLIADEDRALVDIISGFLEGKGYGVIPAFDLQQSWEVLAQSRIDALILDVQDPGGIGAKLLQHVRRLPDVGFLPVVVLSACVDPDQLWIAHEQSSSGFPPDPPDLSMLLLNLEYLLGKLQDPSDGDPPDASTPDAPH